MYANPSLRKIVLNDPEGSGLFYFVDTSLNDTVTVEGDIRRIDRWRLQGKAIMIDLFVEALEDLADQSINDDN